MANKFILYLDECGDQNLASSIFVFTDLSHHRTCGSAYGGSYFGCHSRYEPISVG